MALAALLALAASLEGCGGEGGGSPEASSATDQDAAATVSSEPASPCNYQGEDLTDYNDIVGAFEDYFATLTKVLRDDYGASPEAVGAASETSTAIGDRLKTGNLDGEGGVVAHMGSLIGQVNAIFADIPEPVNPRAKPPVEILSSLNRQRERLASVEQLCRENITANG